MPSLEKTLRTHLERTVKEARDIAEAGAKAALEMLGVGDAGAPSYLNDDQRNLRRRLRIHGRQLGDAFLSHASETAGEGERRTQELGRLTEEVAYEHWHRMLFAQFLAENNLLMYPDPHAPVAVSLAECEDLAVDEGARNGWELAARFAARMLPQIFRVDSPVFELELPPERQQQLEKLISDLPVEVFTASDSLGWVYQFWQANRKKQINESEVKIGARELPAVTQLFTEDYMVDFLLDNTLGAWWAGKREVKSFQCSVFSEEGDVRQAVALPGCEWNYLRFIRTPSPPTTEPLPTESLQTESLQTESLQTESLNTESLNTESLKTASLQTEQLNTEHLQPDHWSPAAGVFDGWPTAAKDLKCLDPCMGSGHFVVGMFERLVALRMAEEKLDEATAVASVIRDNLYGLEIDPRCTQIAAFNLALAAWRRVGYCILPQMNLACSGLAPNTSREEWLALGGDNEQLRNGMERLFDLFEKAPVLGSLINPRADKADLLGAGFHELQPLLEQALSQEASTEHGDRNTDNYLEMAVTARGLTRAAEILGSHFSLVATNVPYLGWAKQSPEMKNYTRTAFPLSFADLSTCFVTHCTSLCNPNCTAALVTPSSWLFQRSYSDVRKKTLTSCTIHSCATLGAGAFQAINGEVVKPALVIFTAKKSIPNQVIFSLDTSAALSTQSKSSQLRSNPTTLIAQSSQLANAHHAIFTLPVSEKLARLGDMCDMSEGTKPGQTPRVVLSFWEIPSISAEWELLSSSPSGRTEWSGNCFIIWSIRREDWADIPESGVRRLKVWGKRGIIIQKVGRLPASLYSGNVFDNNCFVAVPRNPDHLTALWAFIRSPEFAITARRINQKNDISLGAVQSVPMDVSYWMKVSLDQYPMGLPEPRSTEATEWLFDGVINTADQKLQVAVCQLLGYSWPKQIDLNGGHTTHEVHAINGTDVDGIVCIPSVLQELSAADRLLNLLDRSFQSLPVIVQNGQEHSPPQTEKFSSWVQRLLSDAGYSGKSLETWLRDGFFQQHCELFHQRPFIWHIWDGLRDGFSALVNYHKLDQKNLETLIYTYLGDWIARQSQAAASGVDGAQEKLAAAEQLKKRLELILAGEAPHDIFVRWKPLHQQPIGWDPDINDGVRLNIRPFLSVPDVKAKGAGILRVKPKIKWDKDRGKEPQRPKEDFPWFWGWDEKTTDFPGGPEFKGERFNDCHYTLARKREAVKVNQNSK
jgi:hypothetical protein